MNLLAPGFVATPLGRLDGYCLSAYANDVKLSRAEVLASLRDSPAAGQSLGAALAVLGYDGLYWECAVIGPATLHKDFECVALRADHFGRRTPVPDAFADKFARARPGDEVVSFPNIEGDSLLVAPLPLGDLTAHGHIARFVKHARPSQVGAFFAQLAGHAVLRAQTQPVWMSTAGDAVAWLHGRLDSRPKYYRFQPYIADYPAAPAAGRSRNDRRI